MTATIFALPNGGLRLCPTPAPKPARFQPGDWVAWVDGDEGVVTGVIPGHAIAIRWVSNNFIEWYPVFGGAAERIQLHEMQTADETPF